MKKQNNNHQPGWIKLSREITEHWLWQDPRYLKQWIDLQMLAAWKKRQEVHNGKIIDLRPSQCVASISFLADRWGIDRKSVMKFIHRLLADKLIERTMSGNITIITICSTDDIDNNAETLFPHPTHSNRPYLNEPNQQHSSDTLKHCTPNTSSTLTQQPTDYPEDYSTDYLRDHLEDNSADTNKEYKEEKENNIDVEVIVDDEQFFKNLLNENRRAIKQLCKAEQLEWDEFEQMAMKIRSEWRLRNIGPRESGAAMRHFLNHLRKKIAAYTRKKDRPESRRCHRFDKDSTTMSKTQQAYAQHMARIVDPNAAWRERSERIKHEDLPVSYDFAI